MHDHGHDHGPANFNRAFAIGVGLNLALILFELVVGLRVNSLALLADAGHNLSDVLGLLLAWGAHVLGGVRSSDRRTYGWRSSSILAAVLNGLILMVVTGILAWEAIQRISQPTPVGGLAVILVAALGVVINTGTALLFVSGCKHDLNLRGAFLHMAADAAVSLGVVISGAAILVWGWHWVDPVMTLVVAAIIFISTWGLLRDAVNLAMHAVPKHINLADVRSYLENIPGVVVVHDLHVWAMSTTEPALTAHLVKPEIENEDVFLAETANQLKARFKIQHVTLQIERDEQAALCQHAGSCC